MKRSKNLLLFLSTTIFILILLELTLIIIGNYSKLTKTNLKPAISVFERPQDEILEFKHPDLNTKHYFYYDQNGVKNTNKVTTSNKKNIIGFFGDSFTENVGVQEKFDLVNILDKSVKKYNFVNYGIEGFSLDQAFLRYYKYKNHNIDTVIYICHTDDYPRYNIIQNIKKDGTFEIKEYNHSVIKKIIGKLNLTYLILDVYYRLKFILKNKEFYKNKSYLEFKINRFFSYSIVTDVLDSNGPNKISRNKKNELEKNFIKIIKLFNNEVVKSGRDFYIIVYPSERNINLFKNKKLKNLNIFYLKKNVLDKKYKFTNDGHWNEYGNLEVSNQLLKILKKEKKISFKNNYLNKIKNDIDKIYNANKNNHWIMGLHFTKEEFSNRKSKIIR